MSLPRTSASLEKSRLRFFHNSARLLLGHSQLLVPNLVTVRAEHHALLQLSKENIGALAFHTSDAPSPSLPSWNDVMKLVYAGGKHLPAVGTRALLQLIKQPLMHLRSCYVPRTKSPGFGKGVLVASLHLQVPPRKGEGTRDARREEPTIPRPLTSELHDVMRPPSPSRDGSAG